MPTYDYQCEKCGHRFEFFQSMNDARLTDCPEEACDGTVKRLIGVGAGIIFKGSGFYETDYRSDSYKRAAKAESGSGESTGSGGGGESGGAEKASSSESSGGGGSEKAASTPAKPAAATGD